MEPERLELLERTLRSIKVQEPTLKPMSKDIEQLLGLMIGDATYWVHGDLHFALSSAKTFKAFFQEDPNSVGDVQVSDLWSL